MVEVIAISSDNEERARQAKADWKAGRFDIGQVRAGNLTLQLRDPKNDPFEMGQPWSKTINVVANSALVLVDAARKSAQTGQVIRVDG